MRYPHNVLSPIQKTRRREDQPSQPMDTKSVERHGCVDPSLSTSPLTVSNQPTSQPQFVPLHTPWPKSVRNFSLALCFSALLALSLSVWWFVVLASTPPVTLRRPGIRLFSAPVSCKKLCVTSSLRSCAYLLRCAKRLKFCSCCFVSSLLLT